MKKKKILLLLVIILVLCAAGIGISIYKSNNGQILKENTNFIKEEVVVESGSKVLEVTDFCIKDCELNEKSKITYSNQDDDIEEKDLKTRTIYKNEKDEEVKKEEATNEEKTLKDGFKEENIIVGTGTYNVSISHNDKTYSSKLIVEDTTKPELKLKSVVVEENTNVKINDFIEKSFDNSYEDITFEYVEEDKENNTYKKIDKIDISVGERTIYIRAKDSSNNETIEKTTLKVNKKTTNNSNGNSVSNYQNNSGGGSSGGGCSTTGLHDTWGRTIDTQFGITFTKSNIYWYGCGANIPSEAYFNNVIFQPYSSKMVDECNKHFGDDLCANSWPPPTTIYNSDGIKVGISLAVKINHGKNWGVMDGEDVGKGFLTSSGMKWFYNTIGLS